MKLRPYQNKWLKRIFAASGRVLVVGPTGAGKTVVAAALIRKARREGKRVLFIAHRRELVNQCVTRLKAAGIHNVGIIMASVRPNPDADVQVASVQTYVRRPQDSEYDVVIIDEAHHATAKSYRRVINGNPNAQLYGLTATPRRLDGKALNDLFDSIAQCDTADKLIEQGALAKVKVWTHPAEDLRDVKRTGGDYDRTELGKRVKRKSIGNAIDHWVKFAECRPAVCFAVNVDHAQKVVDEFQRRKFRAALVVGKTPLDERDRALAGLATGEVQVVVTVEVLTEGWDAPHASCCIMLRPTLSETLCLQMMGRCMRQNEKWPFSVVLDHVGNTLLHGMPFTGRDYSNALDPMESKMRGDHGGDRTRSKECPGCGSTVSFGAQTCGFCEHVFWVGDTPEEVIGWLQEITVDVHKLAIELVSSGLSYSEAARRLSTSMSSVRRWCGQKNVKSEHDFDAPAPDDSRTEALALVSRGLSYSEAAKQLGLNPTTVRKWCKIEGCFSVGDYEKINSLKPKALELVGDGLNYTNTAKRLGLTVSTVSKWHKEKNGNIVPSNHPKPEEIRRRAVALVRDGLNYSEAAQALSINSTTVARWCKREGVVCENKSEQLRDEALKLIRGGMSTNAVSKLIGVSQPHVNNWRREAGIPSFWHSSDRESARNEVLGLIQNGMGIGAVAKQVGVGKNAVRKWCKAAGIQPNVVSSNARNSA